MSCLLKGPVLSHVFSTQKLCNGDRSTNLHKIIMLSISTSEKESLSPLLRFLSPTQKKKRTRAEVQKLCWQQQQQLGAGSYCWMEISSCLSRQLHHAGCFALTHCYLASPLLIWGHTCKPHRCYCSFIGQWQDLNWGRKWWVEILQKCTF